MNPDFQWLLPTIGLLLTASGLALTIWTLGRNHDWNRRQFAVSLLAGWDERTAEHKEAIERAFPGLVIARGTSGPETRIGTERAEQIYNSSFAPGEEDDAQLRQHLIALLNYFELISMVYWHRVGDQLILDEGFQGTLLRWYDILKPFIDVVHEAHRQARVAHLAWQPFVKLIEHWRPQEDAAPKSKLRPHT